MKQKATLILTAWLMLIPLYCAAAAVPAYLTDGVTDYPLSVVAQKKEPVIGLPQEKVTFSYSFAETDVQYSDFLFAPQPFSAGLKFSVEGTAAHTLTVQLVDKGTGETVQEITSVSANVGKSNEYIFSMFLPLQFQHSYYIRLSTPSEKGAAGTCTLEVLGQEAEMTLRTMQIISGYENGQFIPLRNITRAEMCAMLAKAAGYTEVPPRQIFDDVPPSHWASSYIAFCYEAGITKGTGGNLFLPDAEITGSEMITMLVRMLGRTPEAEAMGGYPNGYMIVAAQTAVTKGAAIIGGGAVTRRTAMTCTYNSLFVPLMVQSTQENETYIVMNGKGGVPLDTVYLRLAREYE